MKYLLITIVALTTACGHVHTSGTLAGRVVSVEVTRDDVKVCLAMGASLGCALDSDVEFAPAVKPFLGKVVTLEWENDEGPSSRRSRIASIQEVQ